MLRRGRLNIDWKMYSLKACLELLRFMRQFPLSLLEKYFISLLLRRCFRCFLIYSLKIYIEFIQIFPQSRILFYMLSIIMCKCHIHVGYNWWKIIVTYRKTNTLYPSLNTFIYLRSPEFSIQKSVIY